LANERYSTWRQNQQSSDGGNEQNGEIKSVKSELLTWQNNRRRYKVHDSEVDMWIDTAKYPGMIGETNVYLICGRSWPGRRMTEKC